MRKLAALVERDAEEIATLETIDSGKPYQISRGFDVPTITSVLRYYAGFADKLEGKSLNLGENLFGYTRNEPVGVVGTITAWNFPLML